VEGSGPRADGTRSSFNVKKGRWRSAAKLPFYVLGPLVHRHRPRLRPRINQAIGAAARAGTARRCFCYVTPKETPGLPTPKTCREGLTPTRVRRAHAARPRPATAGRPRPRRRTQPAPAYAFDWTSRFRSLALSPNAGPANTTTKPCGRIYKRSRILLNVRPQALPDCRPKITD